MKFVLRNVLLINLLAFVLTACNSSVTSDKVEQRIIFPTYFVSYDASQHTLLATAVFNTDNESGEFVQLSSNCKLSFNEQEMKKSSEKEKPCFYSFEQKDIESFPDQAVFSYKNDGGVIFSNKLNINSIHIKDLTLQKGSANVIKYSGTLVNDDETVVMVLTRDGKQYELNLEPADNKVLVLDAPSLSTLKPGQYEAFLMRTSYTTKVNAMDRGGCAETEYHSEIYKITIQ